VVRMSYLGNGSNGRSPLLENHAFLLPRRVAWPGKTSQASKAASVARTRLLSVRPARLACCTSIAQSQHSVFATRQMVHRIAPFLCAPRDPPHRVHYCCRCPDPIIAQLDALERVWAFRKFSSIDFDNMNCSVATAASPPAVHTAKSLTCFFQSPGWGEVVSTALTLPFLHSGSFKLFPIQNSDRLRSVACSALLDHRP
jgi:hypothetical protein